MPSTSLSLPSSIARLPDNTPLYIRYHRGPTRHASLTPDTHTPASVSLPTPWRSTRGMIMDFYDLDLHDDVLDALDAMNFIETTPIQEHAIPAILDGHDLIAVAQTGTGKTAAFLLPVLSLLCDGGYPSDAINCVIMAPTRELAQQIDQALQGFAYYTPGISSVAIYGGNDGARYEQERRGLALGADVIIATPGRLISHIQQGNVDLSRVSFFILDEADRMLDMGFSDDILRIEREMTNPERQTIMFSATMPAEIQKMASNILRNPKEIKLSVSKPNEAIHQSAFICYDTQKLGIIRHLFRDTKPQRVIIFCSSKQSVKDINIALKRNGFNCEAMHSDLSQQERDDVMFRFKSQQLDILVATDIVARGIDIDDIQMVINYEVPRDVEDYVHRIGRTARAGLTGKAITFVGDKDQRYFANIERFLEYDVLKNEMPKSLGETPTYNKKSPLSHNTRSPKGKGKPNNSRNEGKKDKNRKGKPNTSQRPNNQRKSDKMGKNRQPGNRKNHKKSENS